MLDCNFGDVTNRDSCRFTQSTTDDFDWKFGNVGTLTVGTGPSTDHSNGFLGKITPLPLHPPPFTSLLFTYDLRLSVKLPKVLSQYRQYPLSTNFFEGQGVASPKAVM